MKSQDANLYNQTFGNRYFVIAVCLCLIFIFMGLLLGKIDREFEQAEQVQYEYRLSELKAAVRLMEAALVSQSEMPMADKFEGANPMDWIADKTTHYLGELTPIEAINYPGNWFFDVEKKEISYVPFELKEKQINAQSIHKILRFKVRALRSKEVNSKYTGLTLTSIKAGD